MTASTSAGARLRAALLANLSSSCAAVSGCSGPPSELCTRCSIVAPCLVRTRTTALNASGNSSSQIGSATSVHRRARSRRTGSLMVAGVKSSRYTPSPPPPTIAVANVKGPRKLCVMRSLGIDLLGPGFGDRAKYRCRRSDLDRFDVAGADTSATQRQGAVDDRVGEVVGRVRLVDRVQQFPSLTEIADQRGRRCTRRRGRPAGTRSGLRTRWADRSHPLRRTAPLRCRHARPSRSGSA